LAGKDNTASYTPAISSSKSTFSISIGRLPRPLNDRMKNEK